MTAESPKMGYFEFRLILFLTKQKAASQTRPHQK
jgi:hypothetical protein